MNIVLNGKKQEITENNLSSLVVAFCKQPKHVITELNGNIIPFDQWVRTSLKDGDALELVTFVGGG